MIIGKNLDYGGKEKEAFGLKLAMQV